MVEGQVLVLQFDHTVAHGAHHFQLRRQLVALFKGLDFAEETVHHPVLDVQYRFGVAVAHSFVEQEAERGDVDAVALSVCYVDKTHALRLEETVREHIYLVVYQCAEYGKLAVVVYLCGQFGQRQALFYHSAFAGVFDDDFYLLHKVRFVSD